MNPEQWVAAGVTIGILLIGALRNEFALGSLERSFNKRIDLLQDTVIGVMSAKFEAVDARFEAVDAKFEAARQGMLRVEGVLDARLKYLEQR